MAAFSRVAMITAAKVQANFRNRRVVVLENAEDETVSESDDSGLDVEVAHETATEPAHGACAEAIPQMASSAAPSVEQAMETPWVDHNVAEESGYSSEILTRELVKQNSLKLFRQHTGMTRRRASATQGPADSVTAPIT